MFEKFSILALFHFSDYTYGRRTPKSILAKFDKLSAELWKFKDALQRVVTFQPSGVKEGKVISTTIPIQIGEYNVMYYSFGSELIANIL